MSIKFEDLRDDYAHLWSTMCCVPIGLRKRQMQRRKLFHRTATVPSVNIGRSTTLDTVLPASTAPHSLKAERGRLELILQPIGLKKKGQKQEAVVIRNKKLQLQTGLLVRALEEAISYQS